MKNCSYYVYETSTTFKKKTVKEKDLTDEDKDIILNQLLDAFVTAPQEIQLKFVGLVKNTLKAQNQ